MITSIPFLRNNNYPDNPSPDRPPFGDYADLPAMPWGGGSAAPTNGAARSDPPPAAGVTADPVQALIAAFPEHLSVPEYSRKVQEVLGALAAAGLDDGSVGEYLNRLSRRLKQLGYAPPSLAQLRKDHDRRARELPSAPPAVAIAAGTDNLPDRYALLSRSGGPGECGVVDRDADYKRLTNFELTVTQETEIADEFEPTTRFEVRLRTPAGEHAFAIDSAAYSSDAELLAALYRHGGAGIQLHCKAGELRNAVAQFRPALDRRRVTTDFGWDQDGTCYRFPSGRVTARGVVPADREPGEPRVDLSGDQAGVAGSLDLGLLEPDELRRVKRHVAEDLLALHDPKVTDSLAGAAAAAVLFRFAPPEVNRFSLWLVGLTGSGKSFTAKLFQGFFGDFNGQDSRFATWNSTANYLQNQGYYFKDALYLVDDYKPNAQRAGQQSAVIGFLQGYADNTARGRLGADAKARKLRPVRGVLVSTGEDLPEHSASTLARSVVVRMPNAPKDSVRGSRCVAHSGQYPAVLADFVRWLLANRRGERFARRVRAYRDFYLKEIVGRQNDVRIASNLGLLAASFREFARYLEDVWPGWRRRARAFLREHLIAARDEMLQTVHDQQESEVFLATLGELVRNGRVGIDGHHLGSPSARSVGKQEHPRGVGAPVWKVSFAMAREEVQESLRRQNKPQLAGTDEAILAQLRQDGKLLDPNGQPLAASGGKGTQRLRIGGQREQCFVIRPENVLGLATQTQTGVPALTAVRDAGDARGEVSHA